MVALKITNNINVLIKVRCSKHLVDPETHLVDPETLADILITVPLSLQDLFHNPPSYKSTVTLSWKPVQKAEAVA